MSSGRYLNGACIVVALLLLGFTALDLTAAVWPLQPGNIEWRYGALNVLSGSLLTPALGVLILFAAAFLGGRRWLQLTISVTMIVVALGLSGASTAFVLDVLQLRTGVRPELIWQYDIAAVRCAIKLAIGAVAAFAFGILAFRAWRATPTRAGQHGVKHVKVGRVAEATLVRPSSAGMAEERTSA